MLYHVIISENNKLMKERYLLIEERLTEQINQLKKENLTLTQGSNRGNAQTM
jgi:hypothetical protein